MSLVSEIFYITDYECPGCRAALVMPASPPDSWLRCPNCGLPSLPSETTSSVPVWVVPSKVAPARRDRIGVGRLVGIGAATVLVVAVVVGLAFRFVGGDELAVIGVDVLAFLALGTCVMLGLRRLRRS